MPDPESIATGKQVREFISFIGDQPPELWEEFALELKRRDLLQSYAAEPEEEMTIHQLQIFEKVEMPFGIHKGTQIKDIPYDYLCNLFDPNPFMKKLKLYIRSKR